MSSRRRFPTYTTAELRRGTAGGGLGPVAYGLVPDGVARIRFEYRERSQGGRYARKLLRGRRIRGEGRDSRAVTAEDDMARRRRRAHGRPAAGQRAIGHVGPREVSPCASPTECV